MTGNFEKWRRKMKYENRLTDNDKFHKRFGLNT
jgi:hypothetical protein